MQKVVMPLLFVGSQDFAASFATCKSNHFRCHQDCCSYELQFCSEREERCRKCDIFKNVCGKPGVRPECLLFCHKYLLNTTTTTTTTALPTSSTESSSAGGDDHRDRFDAVLTPETLTAIAVPCTLLLALVALCVLAVCILRKRQAWLSNTTPKWLRTLLSKNSAEAVSQKDGNEENHAVDKTMTRGEGDADELAAENADEDAALLNLDQRSSSSTLASNGGHEVEEITSPVDERPAVAQAAVPQRRQNNRPASSRNDGGGASSSAGYTAPSTGGRSGTRSQGGAPEDRRPRGSSTQCLNHRHSPDADCHACFHRDADGSTQHMIQTNDNRTSIHIYTHGGDLPRVPDYNVSRPAGPQPPAHNGGSPGGPSNAAQAPCNDPRLYTIPSNPANHDHDMRVEVAPGVDNPTRQYPHLQNGQNFGPVQ